ncbi:hypothetical protein ON010_g10790 [Phytophthora cinnamomi]|nr:hypothetical protein ON010_g10790 [Phytophthora cinnamomi]
MHFLSAASTPRGTRASSESGAKRRRAERSGTAADPGKGPRRRRCSKRAMAERHGERAAHHSRSGADQWRGRKVPPSVTEGIGRAHTRLEGKEGRGLEVTPELLEGAVSGVKLMRLIFAVATAGGPAAARGSGTQPGCSNAERCCQQRRERIKYLTCASNAAAALAAMTSVSTGAAWRTLAWRDKLLRWPRGNGGCRLGETTGSPRQDPHQVVVPVPACDSDGNDRTKDGYEKVKHYMGLLAGFGGGALAVSPLARSARSSRLLLRYPLLYPPAALVRVLAPLDRVGVDALLHHFPQGAHLAQTRDVLDAQLHGVVDLGLRRETADAEADGRVRQVLAHADGAQHVRRLERRARASAARGHGDVLERHEQTLALHVGERQVEVARVPLLQVAVEHHVLDAVRDAVVELVREVAHPSVVVLHLLRGHLAGLAEANHQRRGEGATAQPALLAATRDDRLETNARARQAQRDRDGSSSNSDSGGLGPVPAGADSVERQRSEPWQPAPRLARSLESSVDGGKHGAICWPRRGTGVQRDTAASNVSSAPQTACTAVAASSQDSVTTTVTSAAPTPTRTLSIHTAWWDLRSHQPVPG